MTELKTLKDIEHIEDATKLMRDEYKGQKSDLHLYRGQALRVEAIKWVKGFHFQITAMRGQNNPENGPIMVKWKACKNIFMDFFNLSEEDLK